MQNMWDKKWQFVFIMTQPTPAVIQQDINVPPRMKNGKK